MPVQIHTTSAARDVLPRQPAPDLTVPLLGGGTPRLGAQKYKRFTMVVFCS
jgi:hypothetical protein